MEKRRKWRAEVDKDGDGEEEDETEKAGEETKKTMKE